MVLLGKKENPVNIPLSLILTLLYFIWMIGFLIAIRQHALATAMSGIALGITANSAVVLANGGSMPVLLNRLTELPWALSIIIQFFIAPFTMIPREPGRHRLVDMTDTLDTISLVLLTDRFRAGNFIVSIGDMLMAAGQLTVTIWLLWKLPGMFRAMRNILRN